MTTNQVDPVDYREAMSRYAGHVQVVTTALKGERRGVTITAACSVSDRPPMVLVCLNNGNPANAIFFDSGCFALNTLSEQHQELANAFAGFDRLPSEERFALGRWTSLASGAPVLEDALSAFDCLVVDRKVTATHTVLFGEVQALHCGPRSPALVYMDRSFRAL